MLEEWNSHFLILNKKMIKKIGLLETLYLSILIDKYKVLKNQKVYIKREKILKDFGISFYSQRKIEKKLIKLDLIRTETKGIPPRKYFSFNKEKILFLLKDNIFEKIFNYENKEKKEN